MNKKLHKLTSFITAIFMMLEFMAPGLASALSEEEAQTQKRADYKIYNLDENNEENGDQYPFYMDENSNITYITPVKENIEKEFNKDPRSIKLALETTKEIKDIKLVVRKDLEIYHANHFEDKTEATKAFTEIENEYKKQGLIPDVSLIEEGDYKIENNFQIKSYTNDMGLKEDFGENYKIYHFKVDENFDFEKNGLGKKQNDPNKERIYIFNFKIGKSIDQNINMLEYVKDGDGNVDYKNQIQVKHQGELIAAILNDKYFTKYKTDDIEKEKEQRQNIIEENQKRKIEEEKKKAEAEKKSLEKQRAEEEKRQAEEKAKLEEEKKKAEAEKKSLEKKAEEEKTLERKKSEQEKKQEEKLQSQESKKLEEVKKSEEKLQQTENKNRADKTEKYTIKLVSTGKLTLKPDEELDLNSLVFSIKEGKQSKILNYKDIEKDTKIDRKDFDKKRDNFNKEIEKNKIKEPVQTILKITYKDYDSINIPITLVTKETKIQQINKDENIDISTWGLKLNDKSIYTVTLDVKSLSDIKEIKLNFLNALDKKDKDIKIDRIVKTDGLSEEDITLIDPIYRDKDNIKDYKDLYQKQIKEKLEKLEIKNPIELSKTLEVGYKYVFFIEKKEESADKESKLLIELEANTKDEDPIRKEIEIEANDPNISQKLNNFIVIGKSSTQNTYNTKTDEKQTTVGDNFGIYKADVSDPHFGYDFSNRTAVGWLGAKMDLYIRIPKDVKKDQTFSLSLPPDFTIDHAINANTPIGSIYKKGDKTTTLIEAYYKSNDSEPDLLNLNHHIEFKVTEDGAKLINDNGIDYEGIFTLGNTRKTAVLDGVGFNNGFGGPNWDNKYATAFSGISPIASHWAPNYDSDTSITKTFTFESKYGEKTTELKDQATLSYGNTNAEGSPSGTQYFPTYNLIAYTKDINNFFFIRYYKGGEKYAKSGYVLNANRTERSDSTTTFEDNTNSMTSKVFVADNGGDKKVGSFKGNLTPIYKSENGVAFPILGSGFKNNKLTKIKTKKTVYVEQTVKIPNDINNSLIVANMVNPKKGSYRADQNITFTGEIEPAKLYTFAKVVKADLDGKGVKEYAVTNDKAKFELHQKVNNEYKKIKENIETDKTNGSFKLRFPQKNAYYKLVETKRPDGFKNISQGFEFYVDKDGIVKQSENGKVLVNENGYIPVENELENPHNKLTIKKVYQEKKPLAGAVFAISNKENGKITYRTSGKDGKIVLKAKEFKKGHYTIKEIKAPDGYEATTDTKEFWVDEYGNYFENKPNNFSTRTNRQAFLNNSSDKSDGNIFDILNKKISLVFSSNKVYAEEGTLPFEEKVKNYNKDVVYNPQTGGKGAQTIKTHAPILTEAIEPTFKQTFYLNPKREVPTTSNSNTVFTIFGKELNNLGQPTSKSSATIVKDSKIKVYKLTYGSLPENPKDFDSSFRTYSVEEVKNPNMKYVPSNDTYQINFGGAFNDSSKPTYIVVLDGRAENTPTDVYVGARLINTKGDVEFPVIKFPNSGAAVSSSATRGHGSINLEKYDILGRPAQGAEFKLINNLTGAEEKFILKNDNQEHVQNTYYLKEGIRPGKYTIVETKAPTANGMTFALADNISDRSWQLTVDDKDKNGKFEYVISADNNLAHNREDDPRNIIIENIPSFRPLNLSINLFEQDGKTSLNGGLFTIEKDGESPQTLTANNNTHTIKIEEPGEYILRQKTVPGDFENKERTWKLNVFVNTNTGNLEVDLRHPYNYIKYKNSYSLDVLNKKESSTRLELPPPYGEVSKKASKDFEFEIVNKRNFRFTIKKIDSKDKKALNGAVFELKGTGGQSKTATTNGLGLASFEELSPGTYTLSEKTPPKYYKKNNKTSTITIADDGSITWSGDLIETKQEEKYKVNTTTSFVEPFKTDIDHQQHRYYPSYMNYKSYADIKDPESGLVEFYLMLQSDINNSGQYTDKDTKVNFFGNNLKIKNLRLYDVVPDNKSTLNRMMNDRNADGYNVNEINISSGRDNHINYPIELKSNIRDITDDKGDYNYKNIEKQLIIPSARFGGNQSNWSFLVKVQAQVIDKSKASSLSYHWWTKDNPIYEASIRNAVNIQALEKTETSKEKILDYNPTLEVANEKEDIKFGKFTINKTDEDGKSLKEATFKLSKKTNYGSSLLDKKYQVEGNFETLIKNTENGNVTFDNLPPGTYDLEETKSPDGYIKDMRKFVVVVQKDGKTYVVDATSYKPESYPLEGDIQKPNIDIDESKARTSPMDLDGRIEVTGYKLFAKKNGVETQETTVDASSQALWMKANLEFPEDTIVGDTFTIELDENLDMRGVSLEDKTQKPFVDEKGKELAKHIGTSKVNEKYQFTYLITKKPENADQLILSLERSVYVNRNKIWSNQVNNISFTNTIAGREQTQSRQFSISYKNYKASGQYPYNGYEIGNEPYIYPSSNRVDVYVQAMTAPGNHTLSLTDSNLDFSNAEVTISKGDQNTYGYVGSNQNRPASFGTEIMDFSHVVESEKITKNSGYVEIKLPGDQYNYNYYNIKVTGANRISSSTKISTTSSIYRENGNYRMVYYTKSLDAIRGDSKAKIIKTPKITVKKTDETGKIFLPGAEFKLENTQGYSQTRTTNSRGELLFTGIKQSGAYTLTETKIPEGYENSNGNGLSIYVQYKPGTEPDGSLDDVSINSIDNLENASVEGNTITVKNKKGPYTPPEVKFANYPNHIQFTKVDEKGNPLEGAKFKLILDKDNTEVKNSEREGSLISYEKLAPGKYQVRETDQPKGYLTPKTANNTVATFTVNDDGTITNVKTYGLQGTLVESNGDHKIYNIPEDGKGKFTIYKKAYKKASGDKEGAKIALTGATFTLSKLPKEKGNPEDLPKTFNDLVKTIAREDGSLKFDSLDPGVYELKETKSPDGYVKSDEVYVVVVAKSGKTTIVQESAYHPESFPVDDIKIDPDKETKPNTRTQVKSLDSDIKVSNYYFNQKDNPGTVKHHKAQPITMRYTITLPRDIIPGDYFTIDLDDKLDLNGLELTEEKFDDLKNEYGEVIAKAEKTKNGGKNSYTFTLTEYVKGKTNITVSGEDNFFVDPNVVKTSGNQTFTNKLGNQSGSRVLYVDYNPYFGNGSDNHGVYYDSYGRPISQYYNNYISAKHYVNRETGKTEIYYYVYGYNNMPNNYNFDLTNYTSDGKKGSIYFDTSTKVEVYKVDNPFKQDHYGNLLTNNYGSLIVDETKVIPSLGDKVVLEANKTPISNRPTLFEQEGYYSGKYNRLKFYLGNQNGVFGYLIKVTTPFDQNSSKPLVVEGEVKQNYSYIARNNYGYLSKFDGNSSLYHKLWIEQYGSSRQGDADKLLNIKLTKEELLDGKAEGKFIPGAGFRLQSRDGYTAYKKTDAQGVLTFENVPEGTYALTETFTPQGYAHPVSAWIVYVRYDNNENKSKISIDEVNNQIQKLSDNELKVYNSKEEIIYPTMEYLNIPNRIEFTKVDYKDSPLNNVQFALKANGSGKEGTTIQTATSGEDGKFAFEKIAPGDYEVWEQQALEGYKTPDKAVASFTVDKDGKIINLQIDGKAVQEGSENKIVNKKLGKIDFIKVKANEGVSVDDKFIPNKENSSPLQGAVFELQKLVTKEGGNSSYEKVKDIQSYGQDGKISFTDLEEGTYKLIETKAPDGYEKPSYDVATFDIKADGEVSNLTVNGKAVKLKNDKEIGTENSEGNSSTIENKSDKIEMKAPYRILNTKAAKLKIVKKDIDGKTLLGGAEFELYRFKPGQNSETGQDRSGEGTEIPETLNPNNLKFNGSLEKYSKETKDGKDIITWVLSNTVANDNTKIKTSSDEKDKGTATISGLSDGIYWLKEIKAPVGYLAHGAYIGPIIIKNGKVTVPKDKKEPLTLKIENENSENPVNVATVTNRKPVYPSTGGLGTFVYSLIGILVMVIGLVAYLMGLRKKREQVL